MNNKWLSSMIVSATYVVCSPIFIYSIKSLKALVKITLLLVVMNPLLAFLSTVYSVTTRAIIIPYFCEHKTHLTQQIFLIL